jgi:hypothetical protein
VIGCASARATPTPESVSSSRASPVSIPVSWSSPRLSPFVCGRTHAR